MLAEGRIRSRLEVSSSSSYVGWARVISYVEWLLGIRWFG